MTTPSPTTASRGAPSWLADQASSRVWPLGLLYGAAALLATFTNSPRSYLGDNRFEFYWAPAGRLLRETSLWDGTRGLGRVGEEFWPLGYPVALLRSLGLSPQVTEHLWHAVVLVVAGIGVLALVRVLRPGEPIGTVHAIAGLAYMFNPFTATFLLPTVLFWNYAIAPWLLVVFLRGVGADRPWRWAAGFALLVFSAGNADLPGTLFALLWLVPAAWWLIRVERTATLGAVVGWLGRAALLTAATTAAALTKTLLGADPLAQRLQFTELPERVNTTSSWAESWRGLGFWLSYFSDPSGTPRLPGGVYYYESALGVLLTFVAPVIALIVVWRSRWRPRLLLMTIALVSLVLMVGSYPPDDPTPFGRALLELYDAVPGTASLRNTYKAGSGLMLAVAILLGIGTIAAARAARDRNRSWRHVPAGAAVVLVVLTSLPFWNGGLYPERNRMTEVPDYWEQALEYLDDQPGAGRVWILPGSTKTTYRWGEPGDDIFDAALRRHPNVVANAFPLSGALSANLVDGIEARLAEGTLEPGMVGPIAEALGVQWVVVRNDLDWRESQTPRPADLETIRADPALQSVETFGGTGENVVDEGDGSLDAQRERALPPVEVFTVRSGAPDRARAYLDTLADPASPPLLVAGDGEAWPQLAAEGLLADGRAVEYTGGLGGDALVERIEGGSPVVITDTNRRRLTRIRGAVPTRSHTLSAGQDLDQPAQELFDGQGTQSVAVFPDASRIEASASGTRLIGFQPWLRPANAFDGDEATAWLTAGLEDAEGSYVRVVFDEPTEVGQITLLPYRPPDEGRLVTVVSLHFSDGSTESTRLDDRGATTLSFAPRDTTSLEIRIDEVDRAGTAAVGFREIEIPGVDLTETVAVPDDVFRAADGDARVADALAEAPLTYLFERVRGTGPQDEELALRRRFDTGAESTFAVSGRIAVDENTPDELLDRLLRGFTGLDVGAWGSSRAQGALANRGALAIDGRDATAWGAIPDEGQSLTVEFLEQDIQRVEIAAATGPQSSPVNSVVVAAGGRSERVELSAEECDAEPCLRRGSVELVAAGVTEVIVSLDGVEARRVGEGDLPARLAEVAVVGADGTVVRSDPETGASNCAEGLLQIDGEAVPLRLGSGRLDDLLAGDHADVEGCEEPALGAGRHLLDGPDALLDRVALVTGPPPAAPEGTEPVVEILERGPGQLSVRVDSEGPVRVSTGQSFDDGWIASTGGDDLGPPSAVNTLSAWALPPGRHEVTMTFEAETTYRWAWATTLVGVVACIGILLWPRRESV